MHMHLRKIKTQVLPRPVWLSWLEHPPVRQKVMGSVPRQGTYIYVAGLTPGWGAYNRQEIINSLSLPLYLKVVKKCPLVRIKKKSQALFPATRNINSLYESHGESGGEHNRRCGNFLSQELGIF